MIRIYYNVELRIFVILNIVKNLEQEFDMSNCEMLHSRSA